MRTAAGRGRAARPGARRSRRRGARAREGERASERASASERERGILHAPWGFPRPHSARRAGAEAAAQRAVRASVCPIAPGGPCQREARGGERGRPSVDGSLRYACHGAQSPRAARGGRASGRGGGAHHGGCTCFAQAVFSIALSPCPTSVCVDLVDKKFSFSAFFCERLCDDPRRRAWILWCDKNLSTACSLALPSPPSTRRSTQPPATMLSTMRFSRAAASVRVVRHAPAMAQRHFSGGAIIGIDLGTTNSCVAVMEVRQSPC